MQASSASAAAEGWGVLRGAETAVGARHTLAMLGHAQESPTLLASDSEPAVRSVAGETTKLRAKHAARRDAVTRYWVRAGEIMLAHVPGSANVVDFLTKWLKRDLVEGALQYLTGARSRIEGVSRAVVEEYHVMCAMMASGDASEA